jgi:hypothetical protein
MNAGGCERTTLKILIESCWESVNRSRLQNHRSRRYISADDLAADHFIGNLLLSPLAIICNDDKIIYRTSRRS